MSTAINEKRLKRIIIALSLLIPVAVAILFTVKIDFLDLSFLPPIYASINGLTALLLVAALVSIKNGKRKRHENLIKICLGLSASFLLLYVLYHMTSESTPYGGEAPLKYVYYFILITHIALSVVVIPFVLFTYLRAITGKFEKHRKLAKISFPLWLYVAGTGVIVYLMIAPYY